MEIGEAGESCAIHIARRLGFPEALLERAIEAAYAKERPKSVIKNDAAPKLTSYAAPKLPPLGAQKFALGDSVRVIARRIGVEVSMRMTQYTYICGEIISFDEGPPQLPQYAAEADQLGGYFPAKLFVISRNLHQLPANCTFKISSALLRDCLHYYTIALKITR